MAIAADTFRPQLLERRSRLQAASGTVSDDYLSELIAEVDAALERIELGSFGICESCHDTIEADRLKHNPLCRFCLDHLNQAERKSHQQDLDLATQIQSQLLPCRNIALDNWETQYRYEPVGAVGGDYCDLIVKTADSSNHQSLFFAVGDVAGKGVAASLLMTHLSAILRSLSLMDLPLEEMVSRANRLFCESTGPAHYATLVCGRTTLTGVEVCNAGHCPPLLLRQEGTERLDSNGLPLGLFSGGQYTITHRSLGAGESLVLYSDGITEAQCPAGEDYQEERLVSSLRDRFEHGPEAMADGVLHDIARFRETHPASDDMTVLVVRKRV
ncbi:SpoIIE family protein phosphatase [Acidicapsa dinghuensis]|uniref:SpoIIE family protein phosphatase n=1 Tax=Acidicapsa dinghuensis TaxID=2218256 RepID=A0ABW1EHP5_9BACT|nr:SpoIIE family protein phosphatase [Acidicapsa dinghuensis]